jgi:putative ABC transport system ATP-binding protein
MGPLLAAIQARAMSEPIIRLDDVDLWLGAGPSRVHVLRGVTFEAEKAEAIGLVGPSGSGKSTLLMAIAGLERIDRGRVVIGGRDYAAFDEDELALFRGATIGFVFQAFHLMETMTALENVAVPLELAGRPDAFERARRLLGEVGLSERLAHYPAQLSGGEQQRVAIARALVADPPIVIADEPTGNLDRSAGGEVVDLLFRAVAERGATLILVTHDEALASRCNRIVRLIGGRIAEMSPRMRLSAVGP